MCGTSRLCLWTSSFHINIAIKVIVLTLRFVIKEPIVKTIYISENVGHV